MKCVKCNTELSGSEIFCPKCGNQIQAQTVPTNIPSSTPESKESYKDPNLIFPNPNKKKSPGIAAILSLLITGLGQIYVGQVALGLVVLGGYIVFVTLFVAAGWDIHGVVFIFSFVSAIFAYLAAKELKEGRPIHKWRFWKFRLK